MKLLILSVLSIFSLENIAMLVDFGSLTHDQLTAQWKNEYYDLDYLTGECDLCYRNDISVIGQKGCAAFCQPHGICEDCLSTSKDLFSAFSRIHKSHKCLDNTEHYCTVTVDAAADFLRSLDRSQFETLLDHYKQNSQEITQCNSLPYFCQSCQGFKPKDRPYFELIASTLGSDGVYVLCPGCSYETHLTTEACSMFHCADCRDKGAQISVCG